VDPLERIIHFHGLRPIYNGHATSGFPIYPPHNALVDVRISKRISNDQQMSMLLQQRFEFSQQIKERAGSR
jgi:hypothetical protein